MLEVKITLRVSTTKSTLEELNKIFGEPTKGFSVGDDFMKGKRKRDFTLWMLESSISSNEDIEMHLGYIFNYLNNKKIDISRLQGDYDIDLFCMLSPDNGQGGAVLSAKTMKKISDYGLNIIFDVYCD